MLLKTVATHVHRLTVKIVHEICVKSNGQNLQKSVKLLHTRASRVDDESAEDHCNQDVRSTRLGSSGLMGSVPMVWLSSALELYPLGEGV